MPDPLFQGNLILYIPSSHSRSPADTDRANPITEYEELIPITFGPPSSSANATSSSFQEKLADDLQAVKVRLACIRVSRLLLHVPLNFKYFTSLFIMRIARVRRAVFENQSLLYEQLATPADDDLEQSLCQPISRLERPIPTYFGRDEATDQGVYRRVYDVRSGSGASKGQHCENGS